MHILEKRFGSGCLKGLGVGIRNRWGKGQLFIVWHKIRFFFPVSQFSLSVVSDSVTPWTAAHQVSLSITNPWSLLKLISIQSVMPSNHLIPCRPLLPSAFPSIRFFSNESLLHIRCMSPCNEYSGLISFRTDWFDLAVQRTLESPIQHSSKTSILWHLAFFMAQFSHPYMTTGKIRALTIQTFVSKIKRHLLLGRKAMTNLDSILKSKDITLLTKMSNTSLTFLWEFD